MFCPKTKTKWSKYESKRLVIPWSMTFYIVIPSPDHCFDVPCQTSQNPCWKKCMKGVCGGHHGLRPLAEKIINQGFYWMTLRKDATNFVRCCKVYREFGKIPWLPSVPKTPVLAAWSFDMCAIDLMGKFPKYRGSEYLIVAVDYFPNG